jgi:hypothetical protein
VVTIYDLQPFRGYAAMSRARRMFLQWRMRDTARHAAMLLPMSAATAADAQRLGASPQRLTVIPPVLEAVFDPPGASAIDRLRERYALPLEFWVHVAHGYAHKNHRRLLKAYRAVRLQNPPGRWCSGAISSRARRRSRN